MKFFLLQISGGLNTEYKADLVNSLYVNAVLDSVNRYSLQEKRSLPLGTL